ncbi:anthranilate synthase component II [Natrarchaeobaculum sulfurireducens]|uniref:anthranilate synthase n=1 Tax=Natrarchaeobaculum sulfurireducens TaxID=2044521 RepID=A0A346PLV4_9EURY|nr:aminodeoxychorismate/anthranilate synthase component II [Natrarchaeobaculum sulfurireducens]AXR76831.1 Anthranilate/para-aminobenzoate synthase component II [Natrarchaeobaculum sulfurireducens]AXR80499.1 Para-aminobenzoate synthase, amidotransferase component [Natrarchaeobaculum sulfurireducens]
MTQILIVDNYDSFAYNLVQYVGGAIDAPYDGEVLVRRNDAIDVDGIRRLDPDAIVVSPGPGTPAEAGVSIPIFRDLEYPTLGVCLGHQALCAAAGAPVGYAPRVVHGKPSTVTHDGTGIFEGLPDPFEAGRYHSLAVDREDLPAELLETASTVLTASSEPGDTAEPEATNEVGQEIVMAVRHRERPHVGVQFHPESILTGTGMHLIENFVDAAATDAVARS